ncbi:hypothetical protein Tco_1577527 [Tanacetum coccineum]
MPKFNKWLSSLLRNKEKLEEIAITTVNAECSAIIMNKVPEKLEDPGKFLIPYSDSPFTAELSASVTLNSLGNEDKVFKPGILVYHAIHDKNLITLKEKLKENISSGTLLAFKKPSFLLPPAEPPNECLKNDSVLTVLNFYQSKKTFPLNVEDVNSFAFIIWNFLPFFTYNKEFPFIFSFRSENFVFDPGILTIQWQFQ